MCYFDDSLTIFNIITYEPMISQIWPFSLGTGKKSLRKIFYSKVWKQICRESQTSGRAWIPEGLHAKA
jgi:hypothetical protein